MAQVQSGILNGLALEPPLRISVRQAEVRWQVPREVQGGHAGSDQG